MISQAADILPGKLPIKRIKWIFFDFDGTLVDSVPHMYTAYQEFLSRFDLEGSLQEFDTLNGPSLAEIISILRERYPRLPPDGNRLLSMYRACIRNAYATRVLPMPGAGETIKDLYQMGIKLLIVTAGERENVSLFLKTYGWTPYFSTVISSDDVSKGKPWPDLYNKARDFANAGSKSILVIEDSPKGVQSAVAAGLNVIRYSSSGSGNMQAGAAARDGARDGGIDHLPLIKQIIQDRQIHG